MKIMVTGYRGMLGKEVVRAIERMGHRLMLGTTEGVNITQEILVVECCPDVVINCAGLVPQRDPPPTPAEMMRVNGFGPWNLADWCDSIGARLIQVSTDCVFDGNGAGPHFEIYGPIPTSNYARSKVSGEVMWEPHLTVRTSFVGLGERGLIAELMKCAKNSITYGASTKLLWNGHTTRFVAEALVMLAERSNVTGLLHIPGHFQSRFDLVRRLADALDIENLQYGPRSKPKIDRRLASERWEDEGLAGLPNFDWQLEWLRRSQ